MVSYAAPIAIPRCRGAECAPARQTDLQPIAEANIRVQRESEPILTCFNLFVVKALRLQQSDDGNLPLRPT